MTLELRIFKMIEMMIQLKDETVIERMEEVLKEARIQKYEASLKPMTKAELKTRIEKSEDEFRQDKILTAESLKEEMKDW